MRVLSGLTGVLSLVMLAAIVLLAAGGAVSWVSALLAPESHVVIHNRGAGPIDDLTLVYGRQTLAGGRINRGESAEFKPRAAEGPVTISYAQSGVRVHHVISGYVTGGRSYDCEVAISDGVAEGECTS